MKGGKKIWAFKTASYVNSSPVVVNGVVYVGSEDANVYALKA
jgi:eukaryotic-like serine/threonine-protein kinase